eukprot:scaffold1189_cov143-Pinguiococcus_pyrenoidosus.AAC.1
MNEKEFSTSGRGSRTALKRRIARPIGPGKLVRSSIATSPAASAWAARTSTTALACLTRMHRGSKRRASPSSTSFELSSPAHSMSLMTKVTMLRMKVAGAKGRKRSAPRLDRVCRAHEGDEQSVQCGARPGRACCGRPSASSSPPAKKRRSCETF